MLIVSSTGAASFLVLTQMTKRQLGVQRYVGLRTSHLYLEILFVLSLSRFSSSHFLRPVNPWQHQYNFYGA